MSEAYKVYLQVYALVRMDSHEAEEAVGGASERNAAAAALAVHDAKEAAPPKTYDQVRRGIEMMIERPKRQAKGAA